MSRKLTVTVLIALVCVVAASSAAVTQTSKELPQTGDPLSTRLVYMVQHNSAKDLAAVLNKHFKGDAEFEAATDVGGNVLLITAKPAVSKSVLETLAKLDRQRQMVEFDVWMLDVIPKQVAGGKNELPEIDEKELSGAAEKVLANIKALQKKGIVSVYSQLQTASLEGKATTLRVGGSHAYVSNTVTSTATTGKPRTTNSILYRDVGTKVVVVPSLEPGNVIALDLQLDDSRATPTGPTLGTNDAGQPVLATEFPTLSYNAKLSLKSGQGILAKDLQTQSSRGTGRSLIVVVARVIP